MYISGTNTHTYNCDDICLCHELPEAIFLV
jgi:hypothetical protein